MTLRVNWPVELHPMLVHFPIALLCFAFLLDAAAGLWKSPSARVAALYSLAGGAVGTLVSVLSGLITPEAREREGEALRDSVLPQPLSLHGFFSGRLVEVHKHWGYVLLALVIVWLGVRLAAHLRSRWHGVAMGVGVLALIALVLTSYYGGDLVYGRRGRERGGVAPASQRIGQTANPSRPGLERAIPRRTQGSARPDAVRTVSRGVAKTLFSDATARGRRRAVNTPS